MSINITPRRVPRGQLERAVSFGGLALRLGSNVAKSALKELGQGRKPDARKLLLTISNIETTTDTLARMRGAAMKLGQLFSMDDLDIVAPEFSKILSRLRAQGYSMPPQQLRKILDQRWGKGWLSKFSQFDVRPFAAASIGQVHKAVTKDGRVLAVKVQFPNIKDTIASDIKNLRFLIKASGFLPQGLDLEHYLGACKTQLMQEADYAREADFLRRFNKISCSTHDIKVPELIEEFSNDSILCMSYELGQDIDRADMYSQTECKKIGRLMIDWTLKEIFDFQLLQSDPNFANYRFDTKAAQLILLDFGATVEIPDAIVSIYKSLIDAVLNNDKQALLTQLHTYHLLPENVPNNLQHLIGSILSTALKEFHASEEFSFAESEIFDFVTPENMANLSRLTPTHLIPTELLLVQRKLVGMVFLLRGLGVALPLKKMIQQQVNKQFKKHPKKPDLRSITLSRNKRLYCP